MGPVLAKSKTGWSPLKVFGIIVLVAVLALGGWVGWSYWGSNVLAERAISQALSEAQGAVDTPPTELPAPDEAPLVERPETGAAAWIVDIPALGLRAPIIAGVESADLQRGLGWYPGTSLPGQVGNFALAGNRVSNGALLRDIMALREGDTICIETNVATFTYLMTVAPADLTVDSDDSWVLDPIPGQADVVPSQAFLTLTTSEDLVPTGDRSVGFGTLTKTETK